MLTDPHVWLAFITLSLLEIVLGIDNIIFLSILVQRLPARLQHRARLGGLALAMLTRIALLFSIVWLTHLVHPWLQVAGRSFSGRDVVLLLGGLFLLAKSVLEIHQTLEGPAPDAGGTQLRGQLVAVIVQIGLVDIVFSLDSVFTAVGLVRELPVMVAAIVVAILVMMWVSGSISAFIARYPTIKMLALAFLLLIGVALIAEGLHFEIPKGYLYFAMAFAVAVEMINVRLRRRLDDRQR
ncbi:MAG: TerC family protein [Gammaproteobacteria bacterium]|nr:MAG: TerC family protein [Gammaproteobacteria bacterium]TLZ04877.1 MAG: TerC family protein [Gammaproteobacteria bacterium]TLZ42323.1 MAG: TerC family protein [Gammaproteobacteria bacterium]